MFKKYFSLNNLSTLLLYLSILIFIIAFNFSDNRSGGWYQQFLPDLNNRPLADIQFLDSLTGYGITGDGTGGDTNYVIKTSNGGENWFVVNMVYKDLTVVEFINSNTGFACGGLNGTGGYLMKTTNAGLNWAEISTPFGGKFTGMYVLNEDTIWIASQAPLEGGIFRTTNKGISWIHQYNGVSNNPKRIYMINSLIGFFSYGYDMSLGKTTDGGFSWFGVGEAGFTDIYFIDTLTGWKASGYMKKTTDGGLTWIQQNLPPTLFQSFIKFSKINSDTIWGVGGYIYFPTNNESRAIIYKTTNSGLDWGYQLPDTSINIFRYFHCNFVDQLNG